MGYVFGDGRMEKSISASRFLVREGSKGWFVYDRERKGAALVGTNPAVNLTKEKAERILRSLNAPKNEFSNGKPFASAVRAGSRLPH
jgi:hypothetical protein